MRAVAVGCAVAALTAFLQGCGGGGSGPSPSYGSCLNAKPDLKTQSAAGKVTGRETVTDPDSPAPGYDIDASINVKLDFDKFNVRFDEDAKLQIGNQTSELKLNLIVNLEKHKAVFKIDVNGKATCLLKSLPAEVTPEMAKQVFALGVKTMQDTATCKGNDGKTDDWSWDESWQGPIPFSPGVVGDISAHVDIKMDKDFLIWELSETETANVTKPKEITVDSKLDVKYESPVASGPTDSDLDWSKWGNCTPSTVNNPHDVLHLGDSKELKIMQRVLAKDFFMKRLSSALEARMKSSVIV